VTRERHMLLYFMFLGAGLPTDFVSGWAFAVVVWYGVLYPPGRGPLAG